MARDQQVKKVLSAPKSLNKLVEFESSLGLLKMPRLSGQLIPTLMPRLFKRMKSLLLL